MPNTFKPQEKGTVTTIVENGFVSNVVVTPPGNPYNHQITLIDQLGNKVGDYPLDNGFSSMDNLLSAALVVCASGLQVSAYGNGNNTSIATIAVKGIKG
jgi:hypothetical protein